MKLVVELEGGRDRCWSKRGIFMVAKATFRDVRGGGAMLVEVEGETTQNKLIGLKLIFVVMLSQSLFKLPTAIYFKVRTNTIFSAVFWNGISTNSSANIVLPTTRINARFAETPQTPTPSTVH